MNLFDTSSWTGLLVVLALESAAIVVLAHLAARWSRDLGIARRTWQAALLALLLLPVVEAAGLRGLLRSMRTPTMFQPKPGAAPRRVRVETAAKDSTEVAQAQAAGDGRTRVLARRVSRPRTEAEPPTWPWYVWMFGAGVVLTRAVRSRRALAKARRGAGPADAETTGAVARLAAQMGLKPVRVVSWPGLATPVAFGIVQPTIAVPTGWAARHSAGDRDAMLAHELAHLAAADPTWMALADVACAVGWWCPASWWAARRLRAACERSADAASGLVPGGREALAEVLVRLGRDWEAAGALTPPRLGIDGGRFRSELGQRVAALLGSASAWRRPDRWDGLRPVALAGLALTMALAMPLPAGAEGGILGRLRASAPPAAVPPVLGASASGGAQPSAAAATAPSTPSRPGPGPSMPGGSALLNVLVVELPSEGLGDIGLDWLFGRLGPENPEAVRTNLPGSRGFVETWRSEGELAVLAPAQFGALQARLLQTSGSVVLRAATARAVSGNTVEVRLDAPMTVNMVTGVSVSTNATPNAVSFVTRPMRFGTEILMLPTRKTEVSPWSLEVTANVTSFAGYQDPGTEKALLKAPDGSTLQATIPIPVVKSRGLSGKADLSPGSTLALRGPIFEKEEVRKAGLFRRAATNVVRSRLFVFATLEEPPPIVVQPAAPDPQPQAVPRLWSTAFSPDGNLVVTTGGWDNPIEPGRLVVWDIAARKARRTSWQSSTIRTATFSPQGNLLAYGDFEGEVRVYDLGTGAMVLGLQKLSKLVNAVAFTPDGRQLLIGGFDETVRLHDLASGRSLNVQDLHAGITSLAVTPDGRYVGVTTFDGLAHLLERDGLRLVGSPRPTHDVGTVPSAKGEVRVPSAGPTIAEWIAFTPDGTGAFTGNWDGTVLGWAVGRDGLQQRAPLRSARSASRGKHPLQGGAVSPDGRRLAAGWSDGTVTVWDLQTGTVEGEFAAHSDRCFGLAFSPDSSRLVTAGWDRKTRLWDAATRRRLDEW